ncbi:hypothetical protein [Paenibacillus taichungensis]
MSYTYQGMEFYKLSDSLEHLGSHCSVNIPKEYPFQDESGMFEVKGQPGVFFISDGMLRDGVRHDSGLEQNLHMYRAMSNEAHDRRIAGLNELRHSEGFGPLLDLAGFQIQKVAQDVPYIGYLRVYPITEAMLEKYEWMNDPHFNWRQVSGVYRLMGTQEIFFILHGEFQVRGDEDNHPLFEALTNQFPLPKNYFDQEEEGPFGGAFASADDYWKWKDPTLFQ